MAAWCKKDSCKYSNFHRLRHLDKQVVSVTPRLISWFHQTIATPSADENCALLFALALAKNDGLRCGDGQAAEHRCPHNRQINLHGQSVPDSALRWQARLRHLHFLSCRGGPPIKKSPAEPTAGLFNPNHEKHTNVNSDRLAADLFNTIYHWGSVVFSTRILMRRPLRFSFDLRLRYHSAASDIPIQLSALFFSYPADFELKHLELQLLPRDERFGKVRDFFIRHK